MSEPMFRNLLRRLTAGSDAPASEPEPDRENSNSRSPSPSRRRTRSASIEGETDPFAEGSSDPFDSSFGPTSSSSSPDLDDEMMIEPTDSDDGTGLIASADSGAVSNWTGIAAPVEPESQPEPIVSVTEPQSQPQPQPEPELVPATASEPEPEPKPKPDAKPRPAARSCLLGWLDSQAGGRGKRDARAWNRLLTTLREAARTDRPDLGALDLALISGGAGANGGKSVSWLNRSSGNQGGPWVRLDDMAAEASDASPLVQPPSETGKGVSSESLRPYPMVRDWIAAYPDAWPPVIAASGELSGLESRSLRALLTDKGRCRIYRWPSPPASAFSNGLAPSAGGSRRGATRRAVLGALRVSPRRPPMTSVPPLKMTVLRTAKRQTPLEKCEDADAADLDRGRFAVSDGASGGIFVRLWAQMLAESYAAGTVDLGSADEREEWLASARKTWNQTVRAKPLNWAQQLKLQDYGAGATLLALELRSPETDSASTFAAWRAWAIGDVCLWIVRDDQLTLSFPTIRSDEFSNTPAMLLSRASATPRPPLRASGIVRPGDRIVLATDAVAQWLLRVWEREGRLDLDSFLKMSEDEFNERVEAARRNGDMPDDDCTLIILHALFESEPESTPEPEPEPESALKPEPEFTVEPESELEPEPEPEFETQFKSDFVFTSESEFEMEPVTRVELLTLPGFEAQAEAGALEPQTAPKPVPPAEPSGPE